MKDYTIDKKDQKGYIKKVLKEKNGTYTIKLADGKELRNIDACEENLKKIISIQEKQASDGVKNLSKHIKRAKAWKLRSIIAFIGSGTASSAVAIAAAGSGIEAFKDPVTFTLSVGTVTAFATAHALVNLVRQKRIVSEIEKVAYRDEFRDKLDKFKKSSNSLNAVSKGKAKMLRNSEDPFSILNIEDFSEADLESIVEYLELEEKLNFTYKEEAKEEAPKKAK